MDFDDKCCSVMLDQTPACSSSTAVTYATKLSIDERDVVMKDLQKLLKSHTREQLGEHKQPGCSGQADVDSQTPEALAERACQPLPSKLPFAIACDGNYSALKQIVGLFSLCLGEISTQQIDEAMQFLAIANALASEEQLIVLKKAGLAHPSLSKCELITKTNAERLISVLHSGGTPPMDDSLRSQLLSLKVVHDCFVSDLLPHVQTGGLLSSHTSADIRQKHLLLGVRCLELGLLHSRRR
uniref:Ski_Sno domain-containing protein n=1 Tax=Globodera pallida TaxID=36090 RepID=A0A183CFI8_GLOPA